MSDKQCGNCMYFDTSTVSNRDDSRATCRIQPPVADAKTEHGVWPKVSWEDWCGAFRAAPEPIETSDDDIAF